MTPLEALQAQLADEHLALHLYGVLGARTSASASPALHQALSAGYRQHRARRDVLRGFVTDAGGVPVTAEAAYDVPATWVGPRRIALAAVELENAGMERLSALVASTAGATREWAVTELVWSAVQSVALGASPTTWPGAPELV